MVCPSEKLFAGCAMASVPHRLRLKNDTIAPRTPAPLSPLDPRSPRSSRLIAGPRILTARRQQVLLHVRRHRLLLPDLLHQHAPDPLHLRPVVTHIRCVAHAVTATDTTVAVAVDLLLLADGLCALNLDLVCAEAMIDSRPAPDPLDSLAEPDAKRRLIVS